MVVVVIVVAAQSVEAAAAAVAATATLAAAGPVYPAVRRATRRPIRRRVRVGQRQRVIRAVAVPIGTAVAATGDNIKEESVSLYT